MSKYSRLTRPENFYKLIDRYLRTGNIFVLAKIYAYQTDLHTLVLYYYSYYGRIFPLFLCTVLRSKISRMYATPREWSLLLTSYMAYGNDYDDIRRIAVKKLESVDMQPSFWENYKSEAEFWVYIIVYTKFLPAAKLAIKRLGKIGCFDYKTCDRICSHPKTDEQVRNLIKYEMCRQGIVS